MRTITILPLTNEAPLVVPTLTQTLAEALRQKFITQSPLVLVTAQGDLILQGRIVEFKLAPIAIQGTQQAAQNRLSLVLHVRCTSLRYPEISWEQSFMNFADFPAGQALAQVQEVLLADLCDRIAQDVVNKTLSLW
ncbi:MAG: LPS assembly lipoprotein LptE [Bacteroidia bacterium]|nr:LPS assembly lipoprotein LptE [Bacteroidia bacterium]MDW8089525.1 LptE family protein [Bacteroidia bacterium]